MPESYINYALSHYGAGARAARPLIGEGVACQSHQQHHLQCLNKVLTVQKSCPGVPGYKAAARMKVVSWLGQAGPSLAAGGLKALLKHEDLSLHYSTMLETTPAAWLVKHGELERLIARN